MKVRGPGFQVLRPWGYTFNDSNCVGLRAFDGRVLPEMRFHHAVMAVDLWAYV